MSQKIPETPKHNQLAFDISMKELKFYVENLQMVCIIVANVFWKKTNIEVNFNRRGLHKFKNHVILVKV